MHRSTCSFAVVLAGLMLSGGAQAQSCPGKLIAVKPIKSASGQRLAELQVYYNAATGKNCARTLHSSATWGKSLHTEVFMHTCTAANFDPREGCRKPAHWDSDWGSYKYQAGPISVYGKNLCLLAQGSIVIGTDRPIPYRVEIAGHCS